ncbi:hypothetical protein NG99_26980 [Erwinia typographi]|uniref:Transposase n=1 Tax=Erwinia typographi TaxID=371042 RepID=A0A0A3YH44_9GAMM|nr:hypothetical protein NG99_26980 [Erwinia typographi]
MLSTQEKVSIINELRQEWSLSRLLIVAGLPRSTFYYHVKRLKAPDRYQSARALVLKIYHQHKGAMVTDVSGWHVVTRVGYLMVKPSEN